MVGDGQRGDTYRDIQRGSYDVRMIGLLLNVLIVVLFILVAFGFSALNSDSVVIHYYVGSRALPLPVVILVAIGFGALLGIVASLGLVLRARHQSGRLRRTLKKTEQEVVSLRAVSAKEHG